MEKTTKKSSKLMAGLAVIMILIIVLAFSIIRSSNNSSIGVPSGLEEEPEEIQQYLLVERKVERLVKSYQSKFYEHPLFSVLKSYISLPLEVGQTGRTNPFEPPLVIEQLSP